MTPARYDPEGPVDEFDWIDRCLRPLAAGAPEALDLLDDAAEFRPPAGKDLVLTTDTIVEGVHFRASDPPELVARKLLRVNLSDLAAKAAEPYGYMLAATWPRRGGGWASRLAFAAGLREDQDAFGLRLLGGDTTSGPGPLTLTATLIGLVPKGRMVRRSGALPGDVLLVSGTIGDGWLGLRAAAARSVGDEAGRWLAGRYLLPEPRIGLRAALMRYGHAAADVSDGLIADTGRIARASGLRAEIEMMKLPLSGPGAKWLSGRRDKIGALLELASGGDDYEVVCAAAPEDVEAMVALAGEAGVPLTPVGRFVIGRGVKVLAQGRACKVEKEGYRHEA